MLHFHVECLKCLACSQQIRPGQKILLRYNELSTSSSEVNLLCESCNSARHRRDIVKREKESGLEKNAVMINKTRDFLTDLRDSRAY